MKIKQTMTRFLEFLLGNRKTGHTNLLNKIGKEHDVYILVHNMQMRNLFDSEVQNKLVPIDNISILQSAPNKPILLDNKVLIDLLYDAVDGLNNKDKKIEYHKNTLKLIKNILLERENN